MAFVRLLKDLMKDPEIGDRFAPVIPDEARTFGMDSLFPTAKIYDPQGQTYEAVDRNLLLSYKESNRGQILHEGISEAGAMASTTAAGTAYATHGTHMIPVYIFYSMFGFQRTGDQMWALGDQLGRGFLLGATAGRTTLTGEGLQHNDGHSVLLASVSPACVSYDAAWAYELAYIVKDALRRMYGSTAEHPDGEDIFYYLTVYNEPYVQPAEPADYEGGSAALERAILRGLYRYAGPARAAGGRCPASWHASTTGEHPQAQILASGVGLRWALDAQRLLADDWGVRAGTWSATSWTELRREALQCEEWNMLQPEAEHKVPYVTRALEGHPGPVVAVSDWIRAVPDQIARWVRGAVHLARHRRLGLLRHPPGRPPVLPRGRRVDHRRGTRRAGPTRRGQAGDRRAGHREVPARPRRERRACSGWPEPAADERRARRLARRALHLRAGQRRRGGRRAESVMTEATIPASLHARASQPRRTRRTRVKWSTTPTRNMLEALQAVRRKAAEAATDSKHWAARRRGGRSRWPARRACWPAAPAAGRGRAARARA